ncbi:MAG: Rrf2 family transcriptional regulator [Candidatus Omnitrophica bacterium]|nr:Rrf2 family transcriptional regulator [Candidatus Omnitrophota bacterium]
MKLITRDTDYAVRAISFIAESKKDLVSADELVKKTRIPRPFLRKILQVLNKKKILKSHKGKGGGFSLAVSPRRIYLFELIKIFQGPFNLNKCTFKKQICPDMKTCPLRKKVTQIEKHVLSELKGITIASLLKV